MGGAAEWKCGGVDGEYDKKSGGDVRVCGDGGGRGVGGGQGARRPSIPPCQALITASFDHKTPATEQTTLASGPAGCRRSTARRRLGKLD